MKNLVLAGRIKSMYDNQSDFAAAVGTSQVAVSNRITGRCPLTGPEIISWAKALNVPDDEIARVFLNAYR